MSSFRIMTPKTAQRASFKKHCGSYTWSIVDRKSLYIKNQACRAQTRSSLFRFMPYNKHAKRSIRILRFSIKKSTNFLKFQNLREI